MNRKHFIWHVDRMLLSEHILHIRDVLVMHQGILGSLLSFLRLTILIDFGFAWDPLDLFSLLTRSRVQDSALDRAAMLNQTNTLDHLLLFPNFSGATLRQVGLGMSVLGMKQLIDLHVAEVILSVRCALRFQVLSCCRPTSRQHLGLSDVRWRARILFTWVLNFQMSWHLLMCELSSCSQCQVTFYSGAACSAVKHF